MPSPDMTPSEAVALGARLEAVEAKAAKRRQRAGGGVPGSGKLPEPEKSQTRDAVAPAVGMGARTYEKAKAVVEAARDKSQPKRVRDVAADAVAEMDATGRVDPAYRKDGAA